MERRLSRRRQTAMNRTAMVLLLLAACGGGDVADHPDPLNTTEPPPVTVPSSVGSTPATEPVESVIPVCDDIEWFSGPEELYLAEPVYVFNEMPIEEVTTYASTMDGFVKTWIDRVHNGWVNVGFTDIDLASAQAELDTEFEGRGVVAVDLPYTDAELEEIRLRVQNVLPEGMDAANTHTLHGRVEVWIRVLDPVRIAALREVVGDEPVCVVGTPLEDAVVPGPQSPGGEGWTYLGAFDGSVDRLHVIGDEGSYLDLWGSFDTGDPPAVDFDASVVVALEIGYSGSCRVTRLDEVAFATNSVELEVNTVTESMMCTLDYNARTYLVALARDRLPAPPFTIALADYGLAAGQVVDDLRMPGSTPTELEPAPGPAPEVGLPGFAEPEVPTPALYDLSCGVGQIGEVNHVAWHTNTPVPDAWIEEAGDGQVIEVMILVTEGPEPTLTLSAAGHDVVYTPGSDPAPCVGSLGG